MGNTMDTNQSILPQGGWELQANKGTLSIEIPVPPFDKGQLFTALGETQKNTRNFRTTSCPGPDKKMQDWRDFL